MSTKLNCQHCPKVIEGLTENQAKYLMDQHKMAKHREEFFKERDGVLE